MLPSLKNLTYLLALKKHLHFSKAAKACFVSQSTLSAGINKLEQDLNVQLVERTNKYVLFTPIGVRIAKYAQDVMFSMQDLIGVADLDFFNSTIKIGIIPTIAAYLLPEFVAKVKQNYPKLKLVIIEDTSANLLLKVAQLEIDFAIFAFPFEERENIIQKRIFEDKLYLVKHQNGQNNELLLLEQGHCLRSHILDNDNIDKTKVSEYTCASLETLVIMINMEIGVSFLPKIVIDSGILDKYPELIIDKNQVVLSRDIGIIYRKNTPNEDGILTLSLFLR
ncbi:MAG: LysR family transcriptional regulator [Gammaproteobacteria bacterium]|uniref:LysR family transcriptional regulator, hydrogen peroxide-inducible genes activator n=1 Tax=endosymbiont of Bathymodiolus septemdierum str. Myojin knoll TaxID=1303921 RepID=A0A0P0UQH1_9GAMM|nr:LysR substrate-binding domain-containing protein [Bathymodiolus septemdierum thioautotrophic gill symbiont]RUA05562.1 MAG: LysR family transcriptional regulator [Gammaproteobacteria bacterium]BAS67429.1 LysR family transcriptional regulator, hydrogen peroxide-inducible genes activator [endosymbiont of Bathymodiolus septemdierum str. Myojin knoll]